MPVVNPVLLSPYNHESMWTIKKPLVVKANGADVTLTHIAATGHWHDTVDLVLLFRNLEDPLDIIKTVLSKINRGPHGKLLYFMSDRGPVIMTFDHDDAECYLYKEPVVITRKDYDLRDTVKYVIGDIRYNQLRLEDKLELVQEMWRYAKEGLGSDGRYFGQHIHTALAELRKTFRSPALFTEVPEVEIHALFREVYRVMNPAIEASR